MDFSIFKPACTLHKYNLRRDILSSITAGLSSYTLRSTPTTPTSPISGRSLPQAKQQVASQQPAPASPNGPSSKAALVLSALSSHSYRTSRSLYALASSPSATPLDRIDYLVAGDFHASFSNTLLCAGIAPAPNPIVAIEDDLVLGPEELVGDDAYHRSVGSRRWAEAYLEKVKEEGGLGGTRGDKVLEGVINVLGAGSGRRKI